MRPPFAIGLLLLLFGFGRLLFIFLLLLLSSNVPLVDLKPEQYRVHLFRSPDGQWLSLLNLRVIFQTPDVVDVEEESAEESVDFDDNDDWTILTIDPIPIRPERNWTGKFLVELDEAEHIYGDKTGAEEDDGGQLAEEVRQGKEESKKPMTMEDDEAMKKELEEEVEKKEEEEEEEGEKITQLDQQFVPELALLEEILPWIPHILRKHHHKVLKPNGTTQKRIHLGDILMGKSTTTTFGTSKMGKLEGEEDGEKAASQREQQTTTNIPIQNETTTTESEPPFEPINEEELALNLHKDSINRDENVLRQILTKNMTSKAGGGRGQQSEAFRDLGGSFILPLLKEIKYDNKSIPLVFSDESLKVAVSLEVLHLGNFDNFQMEYELDVLFHLQWYDVRLANNFTKPVRIREQSIIDKIWRPDSLFFNSKYSYFHLVSFPNFRMRIEPDGHITYTSRVTLLPDCQMNFCNFPHDTQRCGLLISSIAHPKTMLEFNWNPEQPIVFSTRVSLPDLRIKNITTEQCRIGGKLIPSSCLTLSMVLQRDSARYIAEKYLPSSLAMIFSWVAPYVPYNYEEVRIITPITVLLTLVQMEKGNQEVITSYLTSLDIWFVVIKAFTVLSLIESLTVMAYIKRARAIEKQAHRAANEYQKELLQAEAKRIVRLYHRLDHFSRVFFPVAFFCFLMFYLGFIAQRDERQCQEQSSIDFGDNLETGIHS